MKAINLYMLSGFENEDLYLSYYNALTKSKKVKKYNSREIESLKIFVDFLIKNNFSTEMLNDFFYGFEIPQIGKEFDVLKLGKEVILNIEIKSEFDYEKVKTQLLKNKLYLSHLSDRRQIFLMFDSSNKEFYLMNEQNELSSVSIIDVKTIFELPQECISEDIERLFAVSNFLVSPLNTPEKFLSGKYFLTLRQQEIKDKIIKDISKKNVKFFSIFGEPGTGKTLLLYDIAKLLSIKEKVCIIHCGKLSDGHNYLQDNIKNLKILPASAFKASVDLSEYQYVFIDETQRMYKKQFEDVLQQVSQISAIAIIAADPRQTLSRTENKNQICSCIQEIPGIQQFVLSGKVRTNEEISAFIKGMRDLSKANPNYSYDNVEILYANSIQEAQEMLAICQNAGYVFINHTPSQYYPAILDNFDTSTVAHQVIGQEFDNVLAMIDNNFYYENQCLQALPHPNDDYLYKQLLFQEVTRVRERLCILVVKNIKVFSELLKIKNGIKG